MDGVPLTEDDCKEILQKFSPGSKFIKFSIRSLAEEVEGYLSSHFSLTIAYQDNNNQETTEKFFLKKIQEGNGFMTEFAKNLEVFTKEIFVYKLTEELEKIQNFTPFSPKCYLCKENLIVIEDMSNSNFYVTEKDSKYNLEESKVALETLAKYHASFIAYEEKQSKKLSRKFSLKSEYPNEFQETIYSTNENSPATKYFITSNKVILTLIDAVENLPNKEDFKNLILEEYDLSKMDYYDKYKQCVLHCDLWNKNIMFKKTNDKITDCRLIDFQLLRYFLPGYDLSLFFNANTTSEFCKNYKEELLQYYFYCLESKLNEFGVNCSDIFTFQEFLDGVLLCEPSAKIFAFNDSAVLNLPEEVLMEIMEKPELMEDYLIEKRPQMILDRYNESKDFKDWVNKELFELYDALVLKRQFLSRKS